MIRNQNINILSDIAKELIDSGDFSNIDNNKMELLFPFLEEVLGYDATTVGDITIAPAYTADGSYKLDYGLRGRRPNFYKACIKVVLRGSDFSKEIENIKKCLSMLDTEFIVITDCFDYQFLVYDEVKNDLIVIGDYSLLNPENCDQNMLDLIRCPEEKPKKQEYAIREDDEEENDEPVKRECKTSSLGVIDEYDEEEVELPKKKDISKKKKRKLKADKKIFIIGGTVVFLIILLLGIFILGGSKDGDGLFSNFPIIGNQNKLEKGQLDGTLTLSVNDAGVITTELYSRNIPTGAYIKFEFSNGTNKDVIYSNVGVDGKAFTDYTIPALWDNEETIVMAFLRFDEAQYPQPTNVKSEFGEIGEKIVGKEGAPDKFAIAFGKVSYNSQAVKERLMREAAEREALEKQERLAMFSELEILESFGNWKVLPKGFNMHEVNITESRNIYPQIFYDGKEEQVYFYLIVGNINQMQVIRFTDVVFYADGFQWAYQVSSNPKEISVDGGVAKEWVYFQNMNTPTLVSDAKLLADAEMSKITFKGDKIKEHVLSDKEKESINLLINAYNKYFKDGAPKKEWIVELEEFKTNAGNTQSTSNSIKLNYIKKPVSMLERDSDKEKELNEYIAFIQNKRVNNEKISTEDELKLDLLMNKYREVSDDLETKLYNEIVNATATTITNPNVQNLKSGYYKVYFKHNISSNIESGYLNEVYLLPDRTLIVPIKTFESGPNDHAFASFKLSESTFNDFISFIAKNEYVNIH